MSGSDCCFLTCIQIFLVQHQTYQLSHNWSPRRTKENGSEQLFEEIIPQNFPNIRKERVTEIQEAQRGPGRINPRRRMLRHIVITLTKIKQRKYGKQQEQSNKYYAREFP